MISDSRCADAALDVYSDATPAWTARGDVKAALSTVDGTNLLAIRGTLIRNWVNIARDLDAQPMRLPSIGIVHEGGGVAALAMLDDVAKLAATGPLWLTAHSLGCLIAYPLAALLAAERGVTIAGMTYFAPPRPWISFADDTVVRMSRIPGTDYVRYGDRVPDFPLGYKRPRPATMIGAITWQDETDPLEAHAMTGYRALVAG